MYPTAPLSAMASRTRTQTLNPIGSSFPVGGLALLKHKKSDYVRDEVATQSFNPCPPPVAEADEIVVFLHL